MLNIPKYAFAVLKESKGKKRYYPEQVKDQTKQL